MRHEWKEDDFVYVADSNLIVCFRSDRKGGAVTVAAGAPSREMVRLASALAEERERVLAFLERTGRECYADGDHRYGEFVEDLHRAIRNGEHLTEKEG